MRQLVSAVTGVGVLIAWCPLAQPARAQGPVMPGQVVGTGLTYNLAPVGSPVPRAAPPAGNPINIPAEHPLMRRYDPNNPYAAFQGTNLSRSQVVAPVAPVGAAQSWLDRFKALLGTTGLPRSATPSTYFPSLTRRNRERAEERLWRRD